MVTTDDLIDDADYGDLYEDVKDEVRELRHGRGPAHPAPGEEGQGEVGRRGDHRAGRGAPRRGGGRGACVRQVHVARERIAGAQRACWTFVRWALDHRDAAERGQSDDTPAQFDFRPAARRATSSSTHRHV